MHLINMQTSLIASIIKTTVRLRFAVPEKIIGLTLILDFFDRGHSLCSLYPPPAALPSLPNCATPGYLFINRDYTPCGVKMQSQIAICWIGQKEFEGEGLAPPFLFAISKTIKVSGSPAGAPDCGRNFRNSDPGSARIPSAH